VAPPSAGCTVFKPVAFSGKFDDFTVQSFDPVHEFAARIFHKPVAQIMHFHVVNNRFHSKKIIMK
jgi:hypothetical protein